ncbi:unnamed protein product [Phaedon cochleariae]|uniref:Uncharacterized protein n=1 Tax=Phaedon cochleariae TaxID=80249 RepID=A0A9N9SHQ7_PHACE|nr:unnamed protein product [Phaedon cochleariae]
MQERERRKSIVIPWFSIQTFLNCRQFVERIGLHLKPASFVESIFCQLIIHLDIPGTARLLKPDAVPSIFSFPKHLLPKNADPRRKIRKLIGT